MINSSIRNTEILQSTMLEVSLLILRKKECWAYKVVNVVQLWSAFADKHVIMVILCSVGPLKCIKLIKCSPMVYTHAEKKKSIVSK